MRKIFLLFFMVISVNVFSQDLELVESLHHKSTFPASECKKDNYDKYCAVIDVIVPGESVEVSCSYKVATETITNGTRLFMSIPSKKPQIVTVKVSKYQPYYFEVKKEDVRGMELYEIRLKIPNTNKQPETQIIEKEKIVYVEKESSDKNAGKAYLILNISEPDAKVEINGKTYNVSGKLFKENIRYGDYNVYISKQDFEMYFLHVKLMGEPVIQDIILKPKNKYGSLTVNVISRYISRITINNMPINENQRYIKSVGEYQVKATCGDKTKTRTINIKPNKDHVKTFWFISPYKSQTNQSNWFIGCTFSPQIISAGFSLGYCKRYGFTLNAGFSQLAFTNFYDRNLGNGNLLDTFKISNIHSSTLLDNNQLNGLKDKGLYRSYIRIGPMFRVFDFMYLYGAVGCGTYADVKSYEGQPFAPEIHKGFEAEAGMMLKYKRLGLSFGYVQGADKGKTFSDYNVGLHYWMKVQTKRINPEHRFIVGYKFSPNAEFGMTLGVAFGYYEKWGLIMHGGSSEYLIKEGMMLGYYSFEGQEAQGRCRSYYHIGPFFRLNDIFAYYLTIGYGSYKPDYDSIWDGYYTGGWDSEVGIMLKLWRLSFSIGYQHNIGKKHLFQDISVGVQFWLGK